MKIDAAVRERLRKQPVSRDNLAYIIQTIASSYGVWDYEQKTIQLSL